MNRIGAEIILIIIMKEEADRLIRHGLNFGNVQKLVTQYWEANLRVVYYKCYRIRHDKPGVYRDRPLIYIIYGRGYSTNDHTYSMISYRAPKGRRYIYDLIKYGNCTSQGQENTRYTAVLLLYHQRKEVILGLVNKRFKRNKENIR